MIERDTTTEKIEDITAITERTERIVRETTDLSEAIMTEIIEETEKITEMPEKARERSTEGIENTMTEKEIETEAQRVMDSTENTIEIERIGEIADDTAIEEIEKIDNDLRTETEITIGKTAEKIESENERKVK